MAPWKFKLQLTNADVNDAFDVEHTALTPSCITDIGAVTVTGVQSSDDIDIVVEYVVDVVLLGIVTGT